MTTVTTEKADTDVSHAATTQQPSQALSGAPHVASSSEPFKLVFVFSTDLRWLTFHDETVTPKAATVAVDPAAAPEHVVETAAEPAATSTGSATDAINSYQLLFGSVISFANDPHHELAASASSVKPLQEALADPKLKLFLPEAHLILIAEVPGDLNANAWSFGKGVTMITREAAEKLMPSVEFHVQQEIHFADNQTLKLIGVIDLHDYPALA